MPNDTQNAFPPPYVIGLTGGIGSGKSTAGHCFESFGITVIDADIIAREIVEPGQPALTAIEAHFGADILTPEGTLNRSKLRHLIFSAPEERQWLEALTHPLIRAAILDKIQRSQSPYTVLISPLLFETDQHQLTHQTILIDLPEQDQIKRASARDTNTQEQIKKIIAAQMSREERRQRADIIIMNDQTPEQLQQALRRVHEELLSVCQSACQSPTNRGTSVP